MGLFKRIVGFLGFAKDEAQELNEGNGDADKVSPDAVEAAAARAQHLPRKGFSIPIQVPVEKPPPPGPILFPCTSGDGGIQGLRWYAKRLRVDEDGDVADEFISEILPQNLSTEEGQKRPFPRFEAKCHTRHAKVRNQALISPAGKIQVCVELHGRLEWL
ncbi:unnamed protein product [Cuscuta campestris]|uniref:Uncharacterized protein n=2 Tax=Cuscuta sect. Cleistogrammica TaxID=1824901 RepID=A0A484KTF3_9ASTE|nr:hypothetical protein DM860_001861 [Cuscuta australis]VFQ66417.1 unnamed protein product [Cuscuta campestris]